LTVTLQIIHLVCSDEEKCIKSNGAIESSDEKEKKNFFQSPKSKKLVTKYILTKGTDLVTGGRLGRIEEGGGGGMWEG